MKYVLTAALGLLMLAGLPAQAGPKENITGALHKLFPDMHITRIRQSQIPGLYEVMSGSQLYYVSGDGKYLLKGNLYDLQQKRNLSEVQRAAARDKILNALPASDYIEFAPKHPKHTIYVFTDVTCPFCRKLHSQIGELNKGGLAVRYLAFPRNGIKSHAYKEMVSVWCAADRQSALTEAKLGKKLPTRQCKNPVKKDFNLGQDMGVHGTPTIYTADGKSLGGYKPPDELLKLVAKK